MTSDDTTFFDPISAYARVCRLHGLVYEINKINAMLRTSLFIADMWYRVEVKYWPSDQLVIVEVSINCLVPPTNELGSFAIVAEFNSRPRANSTVYFSPGESAYIWQLPLTIAGTPGVTPRQATYTLESARNNVFALRNEIKRRAYNWPVYEGNEKQLYLASPRGFA